jgi:ATP-dependent Clp protease ATP-binding subunit ClpC
VVDDERVDTREPLPRNDRLTHRARTVVALARGVRHFEAPSVGSEHVLVGILREGTGRALSVLRALHLDIPEAEVVAERAVRPPISNRPRSPGAFSLDDIVRLAGLEADHAGHGHIGTEDILLALYQEPSGHARLLLDNLGIRVDEVRAKLIELFGAEHGEGPPADTVLSPEMRFFLNFTDRARRVVGQGNREAHDLGHAHFGTEHILLGLLREGAGVGPDVLRRAGVSHADVSLHVQAVVGTGETHHSDEPLPFTPGAKSALLRASEAARVAGSTCVGTGHLLLGILGLEVDPAAQELRAVGARLEDLRAQTLRLLAKGRPLDEREA